MLQENEFFSKVFKLELWFLKGGGGWGGCLRGNSCRDGSSFLIRKRLATVTTEGKIAAASSWKAQTCVDAVCSQNITFILSLFFAFKDVHTLNATNILKEKWSGKVPESTFLFFAWD